MIQRIQSIYLLISLSIISVLFFIPLSEFLVDGDELYIFNLSGISSFNDKNIVLANTLPLLIICLSILISILSSVFLFKNRKLQMRVCTYSILLIIGFYGLMSFYFFKLINNLEVVIHYSFTSVLPMIAIVFIFMALRAIKKDEKLIKSVDRLR